MSHQVAACTARRWTGAMGMASARIAAAGPVLAGPMAAGAAPLRRAMLLAWPVLLALLLLAAAMTTDITYDEEQYIAAGVMARHLRPYADFIHAQPPVYPLVLSLLFALTDGHYLLAGRLLTWVLSVGACGLLHRILRHLGAGPGMALLLVTACILSPFLIGPMSNTRNDILPLFLLLAGLLARLEAERSSTLAGVKCSGGAEWCFERAPPRRAG
jgi:hypothetical protein